MGRSVINASLFNPHISYDFNINPSSKKEYINLLLNLSDKVKIEINKNDVYEFYYMRNRYFNTDDWHIFIGNCNNAVNNLGSSKNSSRLTNFSL